MSLEFPMDPEEIKKVSCTVWKRDDGKQKIEPPAQPPENGNGDGVFYKVDEETLAFKTAKTSKWFCLASDGWKSKGSKTSKKALEAGKRHCQKTGCTPSRGVKDAKCVDPR